MLFIYPVTFKTHVSLETRETVLTLKRRMRENGLINTDIRGKLVEVMKMYFMHINTAT